MFGCRGPLVAYVAVVSLRQDSRQMCWLLATSFQDWLTRLTLAREQRSRYAKMLIASSIGNAVTKSTVLIPASCSVMGSSSTTSSSPSGMVTVIPIPLSRSFPSSLDGPLSQRFCKLCLEIYSFCRAAEALAAAPVFGGTMGGPSPSPVLVE